MQRENIERLIGFITSDDYYFKKVAAAVLTDCSYLEIFGLIPTTYTFDADEWWGTMARIQEMIIIWNPWKASEWLWRASDPLLRELSNGRHAYVFGSIIGFLRAGTWLDENWTDPTSYHSDLLPTLARIICGPAKVEIDPHSFKRSNYVGALAQAIKAYLFPTKNREGRAEKVAEAVAYIRQHGKDENFSALDELIIERLCHGLLAQRPSTQKVAGVDYLLSNFGSAPVPAASS